ncbi:MAG: hypothetical protein ACJA1A_001094 [Saprospiraceae bacterium]|jgi:hypothetical protein
MRIIVSIIFCVFVSAMSHAQLRLSIESGLVTTQYNDVQAPNGDQNAGTLFSFNDNFEEDDPKGYLRAEVTYTINNRHSIEVTAAPLTVAYQNATLPKISFQGVSFEGSGIDGRYKFNTYRGSYRYRLLRKSNFTFELGASILVRDARIALTQDDITVDNTDLGFVPLVSFELAYQPFQSIGFQLKGDALVGPVGRAEDIFAGVTVDLFSDIISVKAGYRLIEGGADVDQVYNFAYFHFASIGIVYTL